MPGAAETQIDSSMTAARDRALRIEHGHVIRDDIQLLRAVAVLSVLLYHADKILLPGGFLGVDVFFVISGFLITRNIYRSIERGSFSYTDFIARRFRRLLPACYAMLLFTTVLAAFFLTRQDLVEFAKQVMGTVSFSSNIVLWRQSGYFDSSAGFKLLLHTWSLSLEEQYYLFLPPILYLGARGKTLGRLSFLLAGSLLLCFAAMLTKPNAAFYLLPFRAWELLAGSLCAVMSLREQAPNVPLPMKIVALVALIVTLAFPPSTVHPGPAALLAVASTAVLLLGALDFGRGTLARSFYFFGDISYSLYLFHWPAFAVANHVYGEAVPVSVKALLMIAVVILSYLSFRLVEQPFREATAVGRRKVFALAVCGGVLVVLLTVAIGAVRGVGADDFGEGGNVPNYGLARTCSFASDFTDRLECRTSERPTVLLWGDSYAMHLAKMLARQQDFGFMQATKSLCGPVPGVAPVVGAYNESWARDCLSFNDSVLRYLDEHPQIRLVILGSKWRQYFNDEGQDGFLVRGSSGEAGISKRLDRTAVETSVHDLVQRLTASGRQVVFVQPPPSADFDVYRCLQRKRDGLLSVGLPIDCRIDLVAAKAMDAGFAGMLQTLGHGPGVTTYSFDALLCEAGRCRSEIDGVPLYRDEGHFSVQGSQIVGQRSGLNGWINGLLATTDRQFSVKSATVGIFPDMQNKFTNRMSLWKKQSIANFR